MGHTDLIAGIISILFGMGLIWFFAWFFGLLSIFTLFGAIPVGAFCINDGYKRATIKY